MSRVTRVGVDVGATLAKIAIEEADAPIPGRADGPPEAARFELFPSDALDRVADRVEALEPFGVGLTGGGARELAERFSGDAAQVDEFAAWAAGSNRLLRRGGGRERSRYLLVSLGTGTSVLLVEGGAVRRLGGTALGGGTVVGLGRVLLGSSDFDQICALANSGDRARVDLLISDIYRGGEFALIGNATASAFGRLARMDGADSEPVSREDLAAAIMGLVAENVALICHGLAAASQTERVVFGGSTLRGNATLGRVLTTITAQLGHEATLLPDGEFAGALGSLELAGTR